MNPVLQAKLLRDLELKGRSKVTQNTYLKNVKLLARRVNKPLEVLTEEDLLSYQYYLLKERKLQAPSVNTITNSIRYFYRYAVKKPEVVANLPHMKVAQTLPDILSQEEVCKLLQVATTKQEEIILAAFYDTGLRLNELRNLKKQDIDSDRMVIHVRKGKGNKDRIVPMSEQLLSRLRYYWKYCRLVNIHSDYIFTGKSATGQLSRTTMEKIVHRCCKKAGITKKVSPHTLRHTCATHLLESGVDLKKIQAILGHTTLRMTMRYVHLAADFAGSVSSPLSTLFDRPEGGR